MSNIVAKLKAVKALKHALTHVASTDKLVRDASFHRKGLTEIIWAISDLDEALSDEIEELESELSEAREALKED